MTGDQLKQGKVPLFVVDGKVYSAPLPGILVLVAAKYAWEALSEHGRKICVNDSYIRAGVAAPFAV